MNRDELLQRSPNFRVARKLNFAVAIVSAIVLLLVGAMRQVDTIELPEGVDLKFLPLVHAILNSCVAFLLVAAVVMVRRGRIGAHQFCMNLAMVLSGLFLICYLVYHFTNRETTYGGEGTLRLVYYFFLATHIILAAISFPLILYTWVLAITNQFARHRKFARWVFPVWLYVAVTGPLCYVMLRPYYS